VCGNNEHDQLALGTPAPGARPFGGANGDLVMGGLWENCIEVERTATGDRNRMNAVAAVDVQCGGSHSGIVTPDCKGYLFGSNDEGQCHSTPSGALSPLPFSCKKLALGHAHTVVLTTSDTLHAFGADEFGQCAIPSNLKNVTCIHAGPRTSAAVAGGVAHVWGCGKFGQTSQKEGFSCALGVVGVVVGMKHCALLDEGGSVWGIGDNKQGQVGVGQERRVDTLTRVGVEEGLIFVQIDCGWSHTVAFSDKGEVYGWGRNDKGQVNATHTTPRTCVNRGGGRCEQEPTRTSRGRRVTRNALFANDRGMLKTSGSKRAAQNPLFANESLLAIAGLSLEGRRHNRGRLSSALPLPLAQCAVALLFLFPSLSALPTHTPQLGLNHRDNCYSPTLLWSKTPKGKAIRMISCGPENTYVLDIDGQVWGCGWNEHGNLGQGDFEDRTTLVEIKVDASILKEGVQFLAAGGAHIIVA